MSMASRWQRFLSVSAVAVAVAVAAGGCKSGGSWNAKPSWWSFGGSGEDAAKLAAAPPASTDVTKPSATSKPYPTTSTPEGYSLAGTQPAAGGTSPAVPAMASTAAEPAVVTYGSTPPASVAAPTSPAPQQQIATAPSAGGLSGITPQVGPYRGAASTPADTPLPSASAASTAAFAPPAESTAAAVAPASAFGATPPAASADPLAPPAGTRMADARGSDSWSGSSATPGSRYGDVSSSRFSGAAPAAAPLATPPAAPAELQPPPAAMPPAGLPAAPSTPTRRPDPGYRPGGTSSYRPSRTILADDAPADSSPVRQVSFEAAIPPETAPVVR